MSTLIKSILFAGILFAVPTLYAAELYFDGGLGNANAEHNEFDLEGSDTYIRLGIGYKASDTVSLEGGFWDLGEAEDGPFTAAADGLYFNVKGGIPLKNDLQLFGKVGLFMWDSESCARGFGCESDDGNDIFFGGGVAFDKLGPGTLNLEILLMELEDIDVTTIGASYSFPFN